jgi:hypothetical protein
MRFGRFTITEFGGLNEDKNPHALGDNELTVAENIWRRDRTTGTRPGTQIDQDVYDEPIALTPVVAPPTGPTLARITGISEFKTTSGGGNTVRGDVRKMIVMIEDEAHINPDTTAGGGTLTIGANVVLTNTADDLWTFAQHKEALYAAGGDVTTATPWYTTDGAATVVLDIFDLPGTGRTSPRWITEWSNYLFAGGFDDTDASANPGVVRYSALNDGTKWPVGNTIGGFSAVGGFSAGSAEFLTGANSYQDNRGKWLLILSNKRLYAVRETGQRTQPFQITDRIANGCVGHNAYVNLGLDVGDGLYLSDQGIHSLRQSQAHGSREDAFLSFKIRESFETVNRAAIHNAVGAYWRERGLVIFAVPTGASTINDTIFALDVRDVSSGSAIDPGRDLTAQNARWYVWKLTDDTNHAASFLLTAQKADGAYRMYGGNYKNEVFTFQEDVYSDMGEAYQSKFRTKHHTFDNPDERKMVGDALVDIQPGGDYDPTMQIIFDFGKNSGSTHQISMDTSTALWDSSTWNVDLWSDVNVTKQSRIYTVGSGDSLSWEFRHAGTNEPFWIARLTSQVANMGDAANG